MDTIYIIMMNLKTKNQFLTFKPDTLIISTPTKQVASNGNASR